MSRPTRPLFWLLGASVAAVICLLPASSAAGYSLRDDADEAQLRFGTALDIPGLENAAYLDLVREHANVITFENATKFGPVHPGPDTYDFSKADRIADFAQANGMKMRGHVLTWHVQNPQWLKDLNPDRAEALAILADHIETVVGHFRDNYPGLVIEWDVSNEVIDNDGTRRNTIWQRWIGDDYVEQALRMARAAAGPDVKLYINDYFDAQMMIGAEAIGGELDDGDPFPMPSPGATGSLPCDAIIKCVAYRELVEELLAAGAPLDGVGFQAHEPGPNPSDYRGLTSWVGDLGLEWAITELDVPLPPDSEPGRTTHQAPAFGRTTQACIDDPACGVVVNWGLSDRFSWWGSLVPGADLSDATPFDPDFAAKPAADELQSVLEAADVTPPETVIDGAPPARTSDPNPEIRFSSPAADLTGFECRLDSADPGAYDSCSSPRELDGLADGPHRFEVRAIDDVGNADPSPAVAEFEVETGNPGTRIDARPPLLGNDTDVEFEFSSTDAAASGFECSLDDDPFAACTSPVRYLDLEDGAHRFQVRALDARGAPDPTPATFEFTIDTTGPPAPVLERTDPPPPSNENRPLVIGTATEATSVAIHLTGDCSGEPVAENDPGRLTEPGVRVTVLSDSVSELTARSRDAAGNASECSAPLSYTEDSTAPRATIDSPAPDRDERESELEFSSPDADVVRFDCSLDAAAFELCTSPHRVGPLADGGHRFAVRAVDRAGNHGPAAAQSFTTGTTGPPAAGDTRADASLRLIRRQRQRGRRVKVRGKLFADERVSTVVRGRIRAGEPEGPAADSAAGRKTYRLQRRRIQLAGTGSRSFRLGLRRNRDNRRVLRALRRGEDLVAVVTVRVEDDAGNRARLRKQVPLRG